MTSWRWTSRLRLVLPGPCDHVVLNIVMLCWFSSALRARLKFSLGACPTIPAASDTAIAPRLSGGLHCRRREPDGSTGALRSASNYLIIDDLPELEYRKLEIIT